MPARNSAADLPWLHRLLAVALDASPEADLLASPGLSDPAAPRLPPELALRLAAARATGRRLVRLGPDALDRQAVWNWAPRLAWVSWNPGERRAAAASSRLPRALDELPALFRYVREAVREAAERGERWVVADDSALCEIASRAAWRAAAPVSRIRVARPSLSPLDWLRRTLLAPPDDGRRTGPPADSQVWCDVSPPLQETGSATTPDAGRSSDETIPAADRLLAALSHRLDLPWVRRGGNWSRLACDFARFDAAAPTTIRIARDSTLVAPQLQTELLEAGAIGWTLPAPSATDDRPGGVAERRTEEPATVNDLGGGPGRQGYWSESTAAAWEAGGCLLHSVRRCDGPWPGQDRGEYLDELLDERPERDRSALATLRRIVDERRVRASSRGIRGGSAMVCWAALTWDELKERRVWRRHRRRWDFEGYGLAVDRRRLMELGARPVVYGDESVWERLSDVDRPYFQRVAAESSDSSVSPNSSFSSETSETPAAAGGGRAAIESDVAGRGPRSIDWRVEREWRVAGDVDLAAISADSIRLFVPNREEARRAAAWSPYAIRIVGA